MSSEARDFVFAKHVQSPPEDIARMKNIFSVVFNTRDALDYGKSSLLNGKDCKGRNLTIGNKYFRESGFCDFEESVPECQGQRRYIYIDNVPKSTPPCVNPDLPVHSRCKSNENTGLIQGLLTDIAQMNPFEIGYSMAGSGSVINNKCVLRKEKVGYQAGEKKRFKNETRCAPERMPLICSIKDEESNEDNNDNDDYDDVKKENEKEAFTDNSKLYSKECHRQSFVEIRDMDNDYNKNCMVLFFLLVFLSCLFYICVTRK